ncbi:MAG: SMI1/KNR4 family protein [Oscillospiraceae bacterium]|nr:SMI1/KNR4 family protein [Oscillospiraceae bacterium]
MNYPKIPDNSLTDRIKTIIKLSEDLIEDMGEGAFEFDASISDEEIESWEKENGIKIPDSYKDWLRFSKSSSIEMGTAIFYDPSHFITNNDEKAFDVPDECVVIGELGGWGISVCFYAETGEIMYVDHGEECRDLDFGDILDWVIDRLEENG